MQKELRNNVSVYLPIEMYDKLKKIAYDKEITLSDFITEILNEYCKNNNITYKRVAFNGEKLIKF